MANTITISPTVTIQVSSNPNLTPTVISIGQLSFTATVMLYDPQFAVYSSSFGTPNLLPFFTDQSAKITNSAPVVYIRNLDTTLPLGFTAYYPNTGAATLPTGGYNIAPGGFLLFFNPFNTVGKQGGAPDAMGFGANAITVSPIAPTTLNLVIGSNNVAANRIVYAEVLVAA